jgi:hypothetical protein
MDLGAHHRGNEDVGAVEEFDAGERFGGDAHDGEAVAVELDEFSGDVGIFRENAIPEGIADDGYGIFFGHLVFFGKEGAAEYGLNFERGKEIRGYQQGRHIFWFAGWRGGGGVHAYRHLLGNRQRVERPGAGAEVYVVEVGRAPETSQLGGGGVDGDDFAGVGDR